MMRSLLAGLLVLSALSALPPAAAQDRRTPCCWKGRRR